jgi:hypothetical protein
MIQARLDHLSQLDPVYKDPFQLVFRCLEAALFAGSRIAN